MTEPPTEPPTEPAAESTTERGHRHTTTDSPIGPLTLVVDGDGALAALYLPDHVPAPDPSTFGAAVPPDDPAVAPLVAAVLAYLDGSSRALEVPLAPASGTPFQQRVWREVATIGYGRTRTYGEVAAAVGHPGAHRAVGAAVGRNRQCLAVPCHRVVGAGGAVTGYVGGVERKRWLLALEAGALTGALTAEPAQQPGQRPGAPAPGGPPSAP